ncbi:hypothetical protein BLNAU_19339 [Blattamonas nauphoetae]|uniref:Uncharacterized protein n=1 Tax=Blattamonas nauphoetae TaxID=2049346 RepID=A0ABQ9X1R4_9EUKA|nr:hypothetical protein BLNAU_19339 [Blattamonas nauphoetae]
MNVNPASLPFPPLSLPYQFDHLHDASVENRNIPASAHDDIDSMLILLRMDAKEEDSPGLLVEEMKQSFSDMTTDILEWNEHLHCDLLKTPSPTLSIQSIPASLVPSPTRSPLDALYPSQLFPLESEQIRNLSSKLAEMDEMILELNEKLDRTSSEQISLAQTNSEMTSELNALMDLLQPLPFSSNEPLEQPPNNSEQKSKRPRRLIRRLAKKVHVLAADGQHETDDFEPGVLDGRNPDPGILDTKRLKSELFEDSTLKHEPDDESPQKSVLSEDSRKKEGETDESFVLSSSETETDILRSVKQTPRFQNYFERTTLSFEEDNEAPRPLTPPSSSKPQQAAHIASVPHNGTKTLVEAANVEINQNKIDFQSEADQNHASTLHPTQSLQDPPNSPASPTNNSSSPEPFPTVSPSPPTTPGPYRPFQAINLTLSHTLSLSSSRKPPKAGQMRRDGERDSVERKEREKSDEQDNEADSDDSLLEHFHASRKMDGKTEHKTDRKERRHNSLTEQQDKSHRGKHDTGKANFPLAVTLHQHQTRHSEDLTIGRIAPVDVSDEAVFWDEGKQQQDSMVIGSGTRHGLFREMSGGSLDGRENLRARPVREVHQHRLTHPSHLLKTLYSPG